MKKLRAADRIPAVIYGREKKPQNLEVNAKDLKNLLVHHSASENVLLDLLVHHGRRCKPKRLALRCKPSSTTP